MCLRVNLQPIQWAQQVTRVNPHDLQTTNWLHEQVTGLHLLLKMKCGNRRQFSSAGRGHALYDQGKSFHCWIYIFPSVAQGYISFSCTAQIFLHLKNAKRWNLFYIWSSRNHSMGLASPLRFIFTTWHFIFVPFLKISAGNFQFSHSISVLTTLEVFRLLTLFQPRELSLCSGKKCVKSFATSPALCIFVGHLVTHVPSSSDQLPSIWRVQYQPYLMP